MSEIPSPKEQCETIKKIEKESFAIGETVCPISAQWYECWKNQVNYDDNSETESIKLDPIDNSNIIKGGRLDTNAQESRSYYLIHKESYDLLLKWYKGDSTIEYEVIPDSKGKPVVPTRPLILKVNYKNQEKDLESHKYMKISEVHAKARQLFEIPESEQTRLIDYFSNIIGSELIDQKYIEDYSIINNEQILLDYQTEPNKEWYSTELKAKSSAKDLFSPKIHETVEISPYSNSPYYSNNLSYRTENYRLSDAESAGTVGFSNLGNTCFFNSGTQCLMHTVPFVAKFVLNDDWMDDINEKNKIGMKGELARAFASLAKKVWSGSYGTISPSNLKYTIGRFRDTFSGYEQQDSHELIYAMLDGIHEDLNRCKVRPNIDPVSGDGTNDEQTAIEAWKRYRIVNDSIVVDIFDGQVRSRLICPECKQMTTVFDPYRSITMPIEKPHTKNIKAVFVPFDFFEERKIVFIEISSNRKDDFNISASNQISSQIGRKVNVKLGARSYSGYPLQWSIKYVLSSNSKVFAYELPENSQDSLFMGCYISLTPKYNSYSSFASKVSAKVEIPFLLDVTDLPDDFDDDDKKPLFVKKVEEKLSKLWSDKTEKKAEKKAEKKLKRKQKRKQHKIDEEKDDDDNDNVLTDSQKDKLKEKEDLENDDTEKEEEENEEEEGDEVVKKVIKKMDFSSPYGVTFSDHTQKLDIKFKTPQTYYYYGQTKPTTTIKTVSKGWANFTSSQAAIYLNANSCFSVSSLISNIRGILKKNSNNEEDLSSDDDNKKKKKDGIDLDKCFEYFSMPDVLDEKNQWFCPKCRQFVCAEKKLDVWKVPKILIIQLKRFYGTGYMATKLGTYVDFPEILDMKNHIIGPQKNEKELKYRLYAVSNQYGSLGGGHYTANARVRSPKESGRDKGWYNFDDSCVSKCNESEAHSSAAYVLFYERIES